MLRFPRCKRQSTREGRGGRWPYQPPRSPWPSVDEITHWSIVHDFRTRLAAGDHEIIEMAAGLSRLDELVRRHGISKGI